MYFHQHNKHTPILSHRHVKRPKEQPFIKYKTRILRFTLFKRYYFRRLPNRMFCFVKMIVTQARLHKKHAGDIPHYVPFHLGLHCLYCYDHMKCAKCKTYAICLRIHLLWIRCECHNNIELSLTFHKVYCFRKEVSSSLKVLIKCILVWSSENMYCLF